MDMTGLEEGGGASGIRGVYYKATMPSKPWGVRIVSRGQSLWLGTYATIEEAAEVVREHRRLLPPDRPMRTRKARVRAALDVQALRVENEALRARVARLQGIVDRELGL